MDLKIKYWVAKGGPMSSNLFELPGGTWMQRCPCTACPSNIDQHQCRAHPCTNKMGWLSGPVMAEEGSVAELRASVQDLLDSDPTLEVFASDACMKRYIGLLHCVAWSPPISDKSTNAHRCHGDSASSEIL